MCRACVCVCTCACPCWRVSEWVREWVTCVLTPTQTIRTGLCVYTHVHTCRQAGKRALARTHTLKHTRLFWHIVIATLNESPIARFSSPTHATPTPTPTRSISFTRLKRTQWKYPHARTHAHRHTSKTNQTSKKCELTKMKKEQTKKNTKQK